MITNKFPVRRFPKMRTLAVGFLVILLSGTIAFGQKTTPTATPQPADQTDVVKINTALIQIDVTVTDKKGKIVTDIRPDEVEVYENGQKQSITKFSFINNSRTIEQAPSKPAEKNPTVAPPTAIRPEQVHRTIALVVDDLTLSFESMYYARRALKKFVDEQMQDGDLVAIIRTGAGVGALQQFTNDKRQLYAAIERIRWNATGAGGIGAFEPLEARLQQDPSLPEATAGERTAEGIDREFEDFRKSLFATGTLGALNYVVRGMQELPGRKSILLVSDGFRLYTRDADGVRDYGRVLNALRYLADQANRASVVIYTMDARGLQVTGLTAADNTNGWTPDQIAQVSSDRRDQLLDTQEALQLLADETGGLSIINTNDLSGGIRKILDDQSYYLVGYEPDDATFDARTRRYNKLEVKISRPGVKVRYRSGFFGVTDEKVAGPPQTPEQRVMHALTSPFAVSDIALNLNALYYNADKGGVIRSLLHVNAKDLKFTDQPDGTKKAEFDVVAYSFGDNGTVADQSGKSFALTLKKEAYEKAIKVGFVYQVTLPVKKPGAYQLRVALRDRATDKVGSANQFVEVPNLKKNRLVLSGVVLESIDMAEYQRRNSGGQPNDTSSALSDTALRRFKRGSVLNYGMAIYNAKPGPGGLSLSYQTRVFRDGKPIFEGSLQQIPTNGADPKAVEFMPALALGNEMIPGDYVLQVTVTDNNAPQKKNTAMQFVQFVVTE